MNRSDAKCSVNCSGRCRRWRKSGARRARRKKEIGMTAFDWDYVLYTGLSGSCGAITGQAPAVLEETPEHLIQVDEIGRRMKLIKKSSLIPCRWTTR